MLGICYKIVFKIPALPWRKSRVFMIMEVEAGLCQAEPILARSRRRAGQQGQGICIAKEGVYGMFVF